MASEESSEDELENSSAEAEVENQQDNCLHCGAVHDEHEEEEEEVKVEEDEDEHEHESGRNNAPNCDILDCNLYLRRMFVMPNNIQIISLLDSIC